MEDADFYLASSDDINFLEPRRAYRLGPHRICEANRRVNHSRRTVITSRKIRWH
jgi:hypothetical protein